MSCLVIVVVLASIFTRSSTVLVAVKARLDSLLFKI